MNLHYLVREPKNIQAQNPLLLLLHGYGSNEEDLFSFASELPEEYYVISVRAPYNLQPYGHAWYAIHFDADENKFSDDIQAQQSRDLIASFIDEVLEKYPIVKEQVTLIGFSQGSILSYATALSYPEKISRVVALSGYLNENILVTEYQKKANQHLQFYISHGTVDQVIPVALTFSNQRTRHNFLDSSFLHLFPTVKTKIIWKQEKEEEIVSNRW